MKKAEAPPQAFSYLQSLGQFVLLSNFRLSQTPSPQAAQSMRPGAAPAASSFGSITGNKFAQQFAT
jgi:hypothetical protein